MKKFLTLFLLCGTAFAQTTSKNLSLEDIFSRGLFSEQLITGLHSMADGKTYVSVERDANGLYVAKNNYSDGRVASVLFRQSDLQYRNETIPVSTDFNAAENKVLLSKDEEAIYRHSTRANYFVY